MKKGQTDMGDEKNRAQDEAMGQEELDAMGPGSDAPEVVLSQLEDKS
jgi:hypothetical protein